MNRQTAPRLYQVEMYGAAVHKNIRSILRHELLTNFGFEHMFLVADLLIDRFLQIVAEADGLSGHLEPFQTVIYGYDQLKQFQFAHRPYQLHLRAARVHLVTAEEIVRLSEGAALPQLRTEIAVRILREAYSQNVILSFADVGLVMCQSPIRISQLIRHYRAIHPGEFIPHCGSVLDMGSTQTHKREAVQLYLQGHLTSQIARLIQHAPEDVDRYIYDYQRVIELAQEGKSVSQISFVTGLRPHLIREHIRLWQEFEAMKQVEAPAPTPEKEKEKATTAGHLSSGHDGLSLPFPIPIVPDTTVDVKAALPR
jgi:transposase-like protein